MSYLRVANFWKYQNADVWKKSRVHPPWFKHYVHRDPELDHLSLAARLLFWELVGAATRYSNVLEDDLNWLWAETRIDREAIREELPKLVSGGWLSQTSSRRLSRELSRKIREDSLDQSRVDKEVEEEPSQMVSSSSNRSDETEPQSRSPMNGRTTALGSDIPLERAATRPGWFQCPHCTRMTEDSDALEAHLLNDHTKEERESAIVT